MARGERRRGFLGLLLTAVAAAAASFRGAEAAEDLTTLVFFAPAETE